jgi:hypothetical protein
MEYEKYKKKIWKNVKRKGPNGRPRRKKEDDSVITDLR